MPGRDSARGPRRRGRATIAQRRLGARARRRTPCGPARDRPSHPSAASRTSFSARPPQRDPDAARGRRARRAPAPRAAPPSGSSERRKTKLPWPSGQSWPAATRAARTRSRSAIVSSTSMRGSRSAAAAIRAAGPLTRSPAGVAQLELGRRLAAQRRRSRRAAPRSRTPSRASAGRSGSAARRSAAHRSRRRTRSTPRRRRRPRPDERARSRRSRPARAARRSGCSGCRPRSGRRRPDPRRRPRPAAAWRSGTGRRSAARSPPSGPAPRKVRAQSRISSSAPAPRTICSGSTPQYAAAASRSSPNVPSGYSLSRAKLCGERDLRHAGKRRRVLVEAQDLLRPEPVTRGDLRRRGRPDVGRKPAGSGLRPHRQLPGPRRGSGSPSMRASGSAIARARSSELGARTNCIGFRKLSSPSPPRPRASPPVGRTCVAPAA